MSTVMNMCNFSKNDIKSPSEPLIPLIPAFGKKKKKSKGT